MPSLIRIRCHGDAQLCGSKVTSHAHVRLCKDMALPRRALPGLRYTATRAIQDSLGSSVKVPEQYSDDECKSAYRSGFKAGYAAGVQVTVDIKFDSKSGKTEIQQISDVQKDSLLRSLLKGLVWRVFSTALTVSIILAVFHDTVQVEQALQIGGLEFILKLAVYFLHERLWVQIGTSIN